MFHSRNKESFYFFCSISAEAILNHNLVPTVQIGKSFIYLGRYFNFSMDNHDHLSEVLDLVTNLTTQIDGITCHPKNKLLLYHRFVLS